jgi:hypothetical protein
VTKDEEFDSGIEGSEYRTITAEIGLTTMSADLAINGLAGKELQFLSLVLKKVHSPRISASLTPGKLSRDLGLVKL